MLHYLKLAAVAALKRDWLVARMWARTAWACRGPLPF
jgi:hypothetical protein